MNPHEDLSAEEVAFSIALATSLTLTLFKAVKLKSGDETPKEWEGLVKGLESVFESCVSIAGPDRANTGQEKSRILMDLVLEMSRPNTMQ